MRETGWFDVVASCGLWTCFGMLYFRCGRLRAFPTFRTPPVWRQAPPCCWLEATLHRKCTAEMVIAVPRGFRKMSTMLSEAGVCKLGESWSRWEKSMGRRMQLFSFEGGSQHESGESGGARDQTGGIRDDDISHGHDYFGYVSKCSSIWLFLGQDMPLRRGMRAGMEGSVTLLPFAVSLVL
jgi:hypothetical protein